MQKKFLCNLSEARDDSLKTKEIEKSFQAFRSDNTLVKQNVIKIRNVLLTCKSLLQSSCEVILFSIWLCMAWTHSVLFKWEQNDSCCFFCFFFWGGGV